MRNMAENMPESKKENEKFEAAFKIHKVSEKREKSGTVSMWEASMPKIQGLGSKAGNRRCKEKAQGVVIKKR